MANFTYKLRLPLTCRLATIVVVALGAALAHAAVPSEQLMSANTRGYASVANVNGLIEHWNGTQLGQLAKDEAMQPFIQDMRRQIERKLSSTRQKLGLKADDLRSVAAGEIAFGMVERENERAAMSIVVDVTGHNNEVAKLLTTIDAELIKRKAKKSAAKAGAIDLTVYDIPAQSEKDIARKAVFFVNQGMLCASDNLAEAQEMAARFNGGAGSLASVPAYQSIIKQVSAEAGDLKPEVRWFVNPFGYARAARSLMREDAIQKRGKDFVAIFEGQGFDAIQGIGGFINIGAYDSFEVLHRTAVYAPPIPGEPDKYKLAMRMLRFPNGGDLQPQAWMPNKLASYRTFNIDLQNAFNTVGSLFDAIAGYEDAFKDVIKGFEEDPYGPRIKVREALVSHLGNRVTLVTDYDVPITTKSERFLFAIEIKPNQEAAVAATIKKLMDADSNAKAGEFEGKKVWEVLPAQEDVPQLEIDLGAGGGAAETAPKKENAMSSSAVCVTGGYLFVASHLDYLKTFLAEKPQGDTLADSVDFREINSAMAQLMKGDVAVRCFVRTDESYRPTYELLRQGKMPESETLFGRVLNRIMTTPEDEDEGVLRKQQIDGRSLPSFEMVRRYFSPMGTVVRSTEDGWIVAGATLAKHTVQVQNETGAPAVTATGPETIR